MTEYYVVVFFLLPAIVSDIVVDTNRRFHFIVILLFMQRTGYHRCRNIMTCEKWKNDIMQVIFSEHQIAMRVRELAAEISAGSFDDALLYLSLIYIFESRLRRRERNLCWSIERSVKIILHFNRQKSHPFAPARC